jgi:hypothetical protein
MPPGEYEVSRDEERSSIDAVVNGSHSHRTLAPRRNTGHCLSFNDSIMSMVSSHDGLFNQICQQGPLIQHCALSCAGIAPYNGIVPVTANSRVLSPLEHEQDHHYTDVQRWVEIVGDRLGSYAPIRIDCRRRSSKQDGSGGPFYLFDVNLKPVRTLKVAVYAG